MAHLSQQQFFEEVKQKFPNFFINKKVLDIGSLDINGCNRHLFSNCSYTGLDIGEGRNVDVICKAHEYNEPNESFDVVLSSSCFEHDIFYDKTFKNIARLLKPGGLFFFTCDGPLYAEHGTLKHAPNDSPFTTKDNEWCNHYKNLSEADIRKSINIDNIFSSYEFSEYSRDLRFWGLKNV